MDARVHVVTAGGGVLLRRPRYLIGYLDQGILFRCVELPICFFGSCNEGSLRDFAAGKASYYELPLSRIDAVQDKSVRLLPAPTINIRITSFPRTSRTT